MDDKDTITDFTFADGDLVDLDALFDALGVAAGDRPEDVNFASNVLTIDSDGDFSITFAGTSDTFADKTDFTTAAQLAALGIDVGA